MHTIKLTTDTGSVYQLWLDMGEIDKFAKNGGEPFKVVEIASTPDWRPFYDENPQFSVTEFLACRAEWHKIPEVGEHLWILGLNGPWHLSTAIVKREEVIE